MKTIDILIKDVKELVNPANGEVVRGQDLNALNVGHHIYLGGNEGLITFVGSEEEFKRQCRLKEGAVVIDGSQFVVLPGLVDPHTHLPFAGTRQDEFRLKLQGASYQDIARQGGGIKGTVTKTRAIDIQDLLQECRIRLNHILLAGTTTIEAKSGYGLDKETELKQLKAIGMLDSSHPVDIVPTFLGAHEIPEEFSGRNFDFLRFLVSEVMPVVKEKNLAEFVDIFCENGYFSYDESEYYLDEALNHGFKLKIHADEFSSNNAALLAVEKSAVSAEHLIAMTDEEIKAIAASKTAAIFLPGVSFFLKMRQYAPIRKVIDHHGIVVLGSDFNPGSSMVSSQLFIFYLGIYQMGLTIEEAINTVTINAAYAIDRQDSIGSIECGKKMDLILMDIPDYSYLAYHLGIHPIHTVIKSGKVVVKDRHIINSELDDESGSVTADG